MDEMDECCSVVKLDIAIAILKSIKENHQSIIGFSTELHGKSYDVFLIENKPNIAKGIRRYIDEHCIDLKRSDDISSQN
jgi:hypothetical protein